MNEDKSEIAGDKSSAEVFKSEFEIGVFKNNICDESDKPRYSEKIHLNLEQQATNESQ